MEQILQRFAIAFNLNNAGLKAGINESQSLLTKFSKYAGGLFATYLSYQAFEGLVNGFARYNMELGNAVALTGGSVGNINAMGEALKRFGGDTNSVINSLKTMNSNLQQAKFGGGALVEVAKKYGVSISPYAKGTDALMSLGRQLGRFDAQTRATIASQLGLDDAMVRAFADGGKDLEKLIKRQKELGVATEQDIKISNNFNNSILDLKDMFRAVGRDFSRLILPFFTRLVELFTGFVEFLRKHKQLVIAFFSGLAIAMSPILLMLGKIAVANIVAFAPFYAIVGVITAISLVVEDLYYYFTGTGDSITEKIVKKLPFVADILELIKPLVLGIFDTFNAIVDLIKNPSWGGLVKVFQVAGSAVLEFMLKPFELMRNLVDKLSEKFPFLAVALKPLKLILDSIINVFKFIIDNIKSLDIFGKIGDMFKGVGESKFNPMNWFASEAPTAPPLPVNNSSVAGSSVNNTYSINNNINQNISSATPKQFANETNRHLIDSVNLQRQLQGAK